MKRLLILMLALGLLVAACASDDGSGNPESLPIDDSASSQSEDEPIPTEPDEGIGDGSGGSDLPVVSPELTSQVDLAVADLMARLGDDTLIEVLVAHELTWPSGALGCPEPGMSYTDALVDGYRIELSDGEATYHYHGATGEEPFLCETPDGMLESAGVDPGTSEDEGDESVRTLTDYVNDAVEDLAAELDVDPSDVRILIAESVTWRDGSHGCPEPDMSYTQALVEGVRVQLAVEDESYWYHQGGDQPIMFCADPRDPVEGGGDA